MIPLSAVGSLGHHDRMAGPSRKTIIVGIDEAGYGPILGPLVVSACAIEAPEPVAERCLWDVLSKSVTGKSSPRDSRIVIQDSKKLYHRKDGLARLERSFCAALSAWRDLPSELLELIRLLSPKTPELMAEYDWYRKCPQPLPAEADTGSIRIAGRQLADDLSANGMRLLGIGSEILLEGHFNRLVGLTQNKASALFGLVLNLIQRIASTHPGTSLTIFVDRQGGRGHYGSLLMRAFADRQLRVIDESDEISSYELSDRMTTWRISFSQSGETRHLPIALSSIASKYLRELFMRVFNAYWRKHAADVSPTAGYYEDGLRFLREIEPHVRKLGIRQEQLVRQR